VDVFSGVCLFVSVSMFVRMITSKRLNVGPSNLAVRYVVQKSHPSLKVKVKDQAHQGQKKTKNCWLTMRTRACAVARPYRQTIWQSNLLKHRWWFSCSSMKRLVEWIILSLKCRPPLKAMILSPLEKTGKSHGIWCGLKSGQPEYYISTLLFS